MREFGSRRDEGRRRARRIPFLFHRRGAESAEISRVFVTERNKIPVDSGVDKGPGIIGNENVGTKCVFVGCWVEVGVACLGTFGTIRSWRREF